MKTSNENRWAFKVLAGNFISEEDLEGLGISADWHLYLSPTEPPSAAECNQLMNAYDLSACPCCGGRATIIGTLKTCEWSAICTMCGLETAHMMQPKDAALAWNKRHAPDEGPAGIKTPEPNQMDAMLTDKPQNATIVPCDVCRQPNRIGHDCTPPESGGQGEKGRWFCDGPNGYFYSDDADAARKALNIIDPDGDDWTMTDTLNPFGPSLAQGGGNER